MRLIIEQLEITYYGVYSILFFDFQEIFRRQTFINTRSLLKKLLGAQFHILRNVNKQLLHETLDKLLQRQNSELKILKSCQDFTLHLVS